MMIIGITVGINFPFDINSFLRIKIKAKRNFPNWVKKYAKTYTMPRYSLENFLTTWVVQIFCMCPFERQIINKTASKTENFLYLID